MGRLQPKRIGASFIKLRERRSSVGRARVYLAEVRTNEPSQIMLFRARLMALHTYFIISLTGIK